MHAVDRVYIYFVCLYVFMFVHIKLLDYGKGKLVQKGNIIALKVDNLYSQKRTF